MRTRQPLIAWLAGMTCCLTVAGPAAGKAPTHAVLENAAQLLQARAGQSVTVAWTLDSAARFPARGSGHALRPASFGVYVRARGGSGGAPVTVPGGPADPATPGYPPGRYVARLTVPAGGLSAIEIGVQQSYTSPGSAPVRYEDPIAIGNDPFAGAGDSAVPAAGGSGPPWGLLLGGSGGLALLAGAAGALSARRAVT